MRIDFLTLFPDAVNAMMNESILGRAQSAGIIQLHSHQIRDYTANRQNQVDDYPYGGGRGAIMQADPLYRCWQAVCDECAAPVHTVYLSPCGKTFTQQEAKRLVHYENIILVCGHYEGVDERFLEECVDEELSLGDFVLTGGEIPAMAIADCICRMVPGVLGGEECFTDESHWDGLLEYPQYSRPAEWHGKKVPEVLLSGDHAAVDRWRRIQSLLRTRIRRPDLWSKVRLPNKTRAEKKFLAALEESWQSLVSPPTESSDFPDSPDFPDFPDSPDFPDFPDSPDSPDSP